VAAFERFQNCSLAAPVHVWKTRTDLDREFKRGIRPAIAAALRLIKALADLPVRNAVLDAEIVCIDANRVSQFNWLLGRVEAVL